jgi:hypothetical protein
MDELLDRLVANVGIDRATAEKAVGIMQATESGGSGMGGIMGVGTKLMAAGLGMTEMQSVTREIIAYSREKAGEDAVGEIVGSIPGLSQFV